MPSRRKTPAQKSRASKRSSKAALRHAVRIVHPICCLAGSTSLLESVQAEGWKKPLGAAIAEKDTRALFDWLIRVLSYQGVSDRAAESYMETHGSPSWNEIASELKRNPSCPKLRSHWDFDRCGYSKWKATCNRPDHIERCPLPKDQLRNGRLNQTAYSLFLFLRDVTDADLVGWVDAQLRARGRLEKRSSPAMARESLLEPLRHIYGVGDKILNMALASLLLAAPDRRRRWREVGGSMLAVDTLVHKLLHRSGVLHRFGAGHPFGVRCYEPNGCAEIIERVAARIDARQFNKEYPTNFPRFVQHALWRYCAQDGLAECNSVRVKDRARCRNVYCRVFNRCDRRPVSKA